jgi:hypothetical protein
MTGSSGRHVPVRVVIGLAMTGFAFVIAGRRARHRVVSIPTSPHTSPLVRRRHEPMTRKPEMIDAPADTLSATPEVALGAVDLHATLPLPTVGLELVSLTASPYSDSFNRVMSQVSALLEKASRNVVGTQESRRTPAVNTPTTSSHLVGACPEALEPTPEPGLTADDYLVAPPVDIASKAAIFLAGAAVESPVTLASEAGITEPEEGAVASHDTALESPNNTVGGRRVATSPVNDLFAVRVGTLAAAGLPEDRVATVCESLEAGADLEAVLLETFGGLVTVPPLPGLAGSLLVVVGAGSPARRLAAAVAGEIGIDPYGVPFASLGARAYAVATGPLLVRSAEDAAERAPGWRRSHTAVVVVDAPVNGTEREWAGRVISALRPTAVWAVVDATSKTEDIASWAQTLGGVDALALENLDATVSPASALGLGLPVARLNGQPATAARWAAILMDRMNR